MVIEKFMSVFDYRNADGVNQSTIKQVLENPHLWALGMAEDKCSAAMDFGTLCHDLILTPHEIDGGKYHIARDIDKLDRRKKEHKEIAEKAEKEGKILIDGQTYLKALELYHANMEALEVYIDKRMGDCEVSIFNAIQGVECKGRLDYFSHNKRHIVDLKIVQNASKDGFMQAVAKFGYHIQAAFYLDLTGARNFYFIAIEKEKPYMMGVYELAPEAIDLGREKYLKAFEIMADRDKYALNHYFEMKDGKRDMVQTISLPTYAFYKD
jgi:exodeoxyribonuclease VIII